MFIYKIIDVAIICHEANRAFCIINGDMSQEPFLVAPKWQKKSAVDGVRFHLLNPDATPENSHENWLKGKIADGWIYGPVKDVEKKIHPCMAPYSELPAHQQAKDHLFRAIVHALRPFTFVSNT
jgi:hypothetical protein